VSEHNCSLSGPCIAKEIWNEWQKINDNLKELDLNDDERIIVSDLNNLVDVISSAGCE